MERNGNGLDRRAMIVNLNISQWAARKYDAKVSREVAEKYGAGADAGRYNKVLIAQEELRAIQKIANAARTFHYFNSLPWGDNGDRVLPAKNFPTYTAEMDTLREQFNAAADRLAELYPNLKADAKDQLNGLWNPEDYPADGVIRGKFSFKYSFSPMPVSSDFRVEIIGADAAEKIRGEIETRTTEAQAAATAELYRRLYEGVKHMADKLADPGAIFRDSLVNNLVDICDAMPRLNFTGDAELDRITQAIKDRLTNISPDVLRDGPLYRGQVAGEAGAILREITGGAGGRFIDFTD